MCSSRGQRRQSKSWSRRAAIGAFVAGAGRGRRDHRRRPCVAAPWRQCPRRARQSGRFGSGRAGLRRDAWARGSYLVEGIGASEPPEILNRSVIDGAECVSDAESFEMARRLAREEGLFVGGSAGTNVVAAIRMAMRGDRDRPV